jgi:arabinoxylan arabinofuranohydrolase
VWRPPRVEGFGGYLTSQTIAVDYSADDSLSGIASTSAQLDGAEVANGQATPFSASAGEHTFTVVSTDNAGNQAVKTVNLTVSIAATVDVKPDTLNKKARLTKTP